MFCKNCGNEIQENGAFCSKCGANIEAPVQQNTQYQSSSPYNTGTTYSTKTTSKAQTYFTVCVVSMIVSILLFVIGVAGSVLIMFPFVLLAFGVAYVAFSKLERCPDEEKTDGQKIFIKVSYAVMVIMIIIGAITFFNKK